MLILFALILFIVILAATGRIGPIAWVGRPLGGSPSPDGSGAQPGENPATPTPEGILAMRLAEGDISPEEYLERLSMLQGS